MPQGAKRFFRWRQPSAGRRPKPYAHTGPRGWAMAGHTHRGAGPTPRPDRVHPLHPLAAGASTQPQAPAGVQAPLCKVLHDGGRADGRQPHRITPAPGVHGPLNKLWLHVLGVALARGRQEQRPPALWARTAPRSWLPGRRRALPDESGPVAIGAGPPLGPPRGARSQGWFCAMQRSIQVSRSTVLKHFHRLFQRLHDAS